MAKRSGWYTIGVLIGYALVGLAILTRWIVLSAVVAAAIALLILR